MNKTAQVITEDEKNDLLLLLASDFKRYYFDQWRFEMAQQRSKDDEFSAQTLYVKGKISDAVQPLQQQNLRLQQDLCTCFETIDILTDCVQALTEQLNAIELRLDRLEKKE